MRDLRRYLAGAAAAQAGDGMSGPALLLLGFAVTGRRGHRLGLLASLAISRERRAARCSGRCSTAAAGRTASWPGRWPPTRWASWPCRPPWANWQIPALAAIALLAGLFNPAVTGGWTAQLPRVVTEHKLDRGSALDALTFSAASLAGPALAAGIAAGIGARAAVLTAVALVALAVPAACSLSRYRQAAVAGEDRRPVTPGPDNTGPVTPGLMTPGLMTLGGQIAAGFAVIVARRPLRRATVTSVVSYAGIGVLLVCCPVLGAERLGNPARGALLISAMAVASLTANAILARRPVPRAAGARAARARTPGCSPARW